MPNIPTLNVNGKIISNFEKKSKTLQFTRCLSVYPINNSSVLSPLEYNTNRQLASGNIKDDIYLMLKNLNPEKAYG